jgi:hypothetical protein
MEVSVRMREEYVISLAPERAGLFHHWAATRGVSPNELFLQALAIGVANLVCEELGTSPPTSQEAVKPAVQDHLLDCLAEEVAYQMGAEVSAAP